MHASVLLLVISSRAVGPMLRRFVQISLTPSSQRQTIILEKQRMSFVVSFSSAGSQTTWLCLLYLHQLLTVSTMSCTVSQSPCNQCQSISLIRCCPQISLVMRNRSVINLLTAGANIQSQKSFETIGTIPALLLIPYPTVITISEIVWSRLIIHSI